jgi:hypothetical protein
VLAAFRRRLSYANVVASTALFVALGGTGYAAITITGSNVRDSSLTGRDIKNSSIASADIKNGSLLRKDFKAGQLVPGAPGAAGAPGQKGDAGTPGTALAYAAVTSNGTVDETRSKGVVDANVSATANVYCFSGLAFTPKNVMVTTLESPRTTMVEMTGGVCQFRVVLSAANDFMVLIN